MRLRVFHCAHGDVYTAATKDPEEFRAWDSAFTSTELVDDRCGYDLGAGWNPARCGNTMPCSDHGSMVCDVCGEPATEACSYAGSMFVCGRPLCTNHDGSCGRH